MLVRRDLFNQLLNMAVNNIEYLNAKDEDIKWITVKGNHIPIKKGQSQDEAVKAFLSKVESKSSKKVADKTQTKEFKDWFGDSKVVDKKGNPLVVYHGTNEEFDTFKKKEVGSNTGNYGHLGYGFYFSDDKREAKGYGNNIMETYISIKKPFRGTDEELKKYAKELDIEPDIETVNKNDLLEEIKKVDTKAYNLAKLLTEYDYSTAWDKFLEKNDFSDNVLDLNTVSSWMQELSENNLTEYSLNEIKEKFKNIETKKEYSYISSLPYLLDLGEYKEKVIDFTNALKRDGYDGVIYGSEIVAFNANQIKSINNKGNFSKSDNNIYN